MTRLFRGYLALFLALALTLTGHQAAFARGSLPAVGEAVICIGQTVVTVRVDANGQPVTATHLCPDIAATLFVAEAGGFAATAPVAAWVPLDPPLIPVLSAALADVAPQARGPPRVV
ncbi:hypothetical protein [Thetidibacter halocola]|uniref:Uncharacterized protein n=1 Tax=Thetidibacter halocola TaxID=2827239 RepID=A0A8J7WBR4_9RHOB|nr:hypothetical protein [Thetidibacter halocola]MBS0124610.1 hypothetical protein [Thetidibacter halocola]